jgi:hypothetical protein
MYDFLIECFKELSQNFDDKQMERNEEISKCLKLIDIFFEQKGCIFP